MNKSTQIILKIVITIVFIFVVTFINQLVIRARGTHHIGIPIIILMPIMIGGVYLIWKKIGK